MLLVSLHRLTPNATTNSRPSRADAKLSILIILKGNQQEKLKMFISEFAASNPVILYTSTESWKQIACFAGFGFHS